MHTFLGALIYVACLALLILALMAEVWGARKGN
jgi:hypothetical protein